MTNSTHPHTYHNPDTNAKAVTPNTRPQNPIPKKGRVQAMKVTLTGDLGEVDHYFPAWQTLRKPWDTLLGQVEELANAYKSGCEAKVWLVHTRDRSSRLTYHTAAGWSVQE